MSSFRLLSVWHDLRAGMYRSRTELAELQFARLRKVVEHAYQNVPFYRRRFDEVGFLPRHLKKLADLEAVPVTTRVDLQATPASDLVAKGYEIHKLFATRTGGCTGLPLTVYRSQAERRFQKLISMRMWLYHGFRLNERVLTFSGRPTTLYQKRWLGHLPVPARWNVRFMEPHETMLNALSTLQPGILYGYSYHVAQVARLARELGVQASHLRLVATSGDLLPPGFRSLIRDVWDVDPIDIYNSSECGDIGWQCRSRNGFHLNADQLAVEFLRGGRNVAGGEPGEVAVTNLFRYAMPLIRYSLGDIGIPDDDRCDCDIGLPIMLSMEGRVLDVCPLPDGSWFIGFNRILSDVGTIRRFQVIQSALDHFEIGIVPGAGYSSDVRNRIVRDLRMQFDDSITIQVLEVAEDELRQLQGKRTPVFPFARMNFGNGEPADREGSIVS